MKIKISRYPVPMLIGCAPEERIAGQEVLVSLTIDCAAAANIGQNDELAETLDYGEVIAAIDHCLQGRSIKLIEHAVILLGNELLQRFALIEGLEVELVKRLLPQGIGRGAPVSVSHTFQR